MGGHCLPLDPIDFTRPPLSGLSGWPFGREALDPFYRRAHAYCDLGAYDYAPGVGSGVSERDLLLPDNPALETAVIRLSTPTRFGEKYASALEAAGNVRLLLWTNVTHIEMDGAGRAGALRTATLTGLTREIRARLVVIACGAVENARLMLASNARNGKHFGDAGGFLGACYMDHVAGGAGFLHFREPPGPKAYWTEKRSADGVPVYHVWRLRDAVLAREELANAHFYIIPFSEDPEERRRERDARHSLASLKSIAKWALGYRQPGFRLSEAYCSFINKADSLVAQGWIDMAGGTPVRRA